jgi:hypothetical protein
MRSCLDPDLLDLEHGLPVTPEDVVAQRGLSQTLARGTFDEYIESLSRPDSLPSAPSVPRRGPQGEPFVLPF